ncbi:MAG TPA: hypothetical protein ENN29_03345 [Candidatus Hydrogenedentes bacterium]|mgnify:CR=1 FL=1|nr:hypothetical protein [Candidatus Hydrogenedentota bacterium]
MTPTLGGFALEQWRAAVTEKQRYEKGRWQRHIVIRGAADTFETSAQLTEALDALAGAALAPEPVLLRLRPERSVAVRLRGFERTRNDDAIAGAFTLELEGLTPWEEGDDIQTHEEAVVGNGAVCEIASGGSLITPLSLTFTASGLVLLPQFSDGMRTLSYAGMIPDGAALDVDSVARKVFLNGADVSSQASGEFLEIAPQPTTVSFAADEDGAQAGALALRWRERWL